jgi:hypothetical protein
MPKHLSNYELVTLAVFLLGGDSHCVDTEDVAVKVNEIAPGRFTWRKYPDQINIEYVRVRLSEAKKSESGAYLTGSGAGGWMLTEHGLVFARSRVKNLRGADLARKRLSARDKQWLRTERIRLLTSEAFQKSKATGIETVTKQEAEAFFRLDDYVIGSARSRKLTRILNAFGGDSDLGQTIRDLADKVRNES